MAAISCQTKASSSINSSLASGNSSNITRWAVRMRMLAKPILITTNQTRIHSAKLINLILTRMRTGSSHRLCLSEHKSLPLSMLNRQRSKIPCTSTCLPHNKTHRLGNSILRRLPKRVLPSLGTGPKRALRQSPNTTRTSWTTCSTRICWRTTMMIWTKICTIMASPSTEAKISEKYFF